MRISTKAQYGLRAMVYLAHLYKYRPSKPCPLKKIAKTEGIPFDYLEKIMTCLEKAGLVTARKGAQGGYFLAKNPQKMRLGEIVKVLEGELMLVKCIEGQHCPQAKKCLTKSFWKKIQRTLNAALDSLTLADLIKK